MAKRKRVFAEELRHFADECAAVSQYWFGYLAIQETTAGNAAALTRANRDPHFWHTARSALQLSALITLGRIFDTRSRHNVSTLMLAAEQDRQALSVDALRQRRKYEFAGREEVLEAYLAEAFRPQPGFARNHRRFVDAKRKLYVKRYRQLRNRVAHEIADRAEVALRDGV